MKKKKYNNLNELNNERGKLYDNINYNNLDTSTINKDNNNLIKTAFNLYKKQELYNNNLNQEISNYLLIKK